MIALLTKPTTPNFPGGILEIRVEDGLRLSLPPSAQHICPPGPIWYMVPGCSPLKRRKNVHPSPPGAPAAQPVTAGFQVSLSGLYQEP